LVVGGWYHFEDPQSEMSFLESFELETSKERLRYTPKLDSNT
jgi:hypothetical protein